MENRDGVPVIPGVVEVRRLDDYLEIIARAVFQAGLSWRQIAEKWGAYRRAFANFDCERVAAYGDVEIERALMEPGVLRSDKKARAIVANAKTLLSVNAEFGAASAADISGMQRYLRSFPDYPAFEKNFRKRFTFMGEMNVWYFLFRSGEPVPEFEAWVKTIKGDHPRMREMVSLAAERAPSS